MQEFSQAPQDVRAEALDEAEVLNRLRAQIARLEGGPAPAASPLSCPRTLQDKIALVREVLATSGGVHEIIAETATLPDLAAATGFLLTFAAADMKTPKSHKGGRGNGTILWCRRPAYASRPTPYCGGLDRRTLDPARFIFAEARSRDDLLWVLEEGLRGVNGRGSAVACVIGEISGLPATALRRLHLAARETSTPLLLLHPDPRHAAPHVPSGPVTSRWRVGRMRASQATRSPRWRVNLMRGPKGLPPAEGVIDVSMPDRLPGGLHG